MSKQEDNKGLQNPTKTPKPNYYIENLLSSVLVFLPAVSLIYSSFLLYSHETHSSCICSLIKAVLTAIKTNKTKMQIKDYISEGALSNTFHLKSQDRKQAKT